MVLASTSTHGEDIFSTGYGYYVQIDGDPNQEYGVSWRDEVEPIPLSHLPVLLLGLCSQQWE